MEENKNTITPSPKFSQPANGEAPFPNATPEEDPETAEVEIQPTIYNQAHETRGVANSEMNKTTSQKNISSPETEDEKPTASKINMLSFAKRGPEFKDRRVNCCFYFFSCLLCFFIIYLILFFFWIAWTMHITTHSSKCTSLSIDKIRPTTYEYDPAQFTKLNISTKGNFVRREVHISQNENNTNNIQMDVRFNSLEDSSRDESLQEDGDTKILHLTQKPLNWRFWDNINYGRAKCARARVEIKLPPLESNNNLTTTFNFQSFDVTLLPNVKPYNFTALNIFVDDGYIKLQGFSANSASFVVKNGGSVLGYVDSLGERLSVKTDKDLVKLQLHVAKKTQQPKIEINTDTGNVTLNLDNTFSGDYNVSSIEGSIAINDATKKFTNSGGAHSQAGYVNLTNEDFAVKGTLNIQSRRGDVEINFGRRNDFMISPGSKVELRFILMAGVFLLNTFFLSL